MWQQHSLTVRVVPLPEFDTAAGQQPSILLNMRNKQAVVLTVRDRRGSKEQAELGIEFTKPAADDNGDALAMFIPFLVKADPVAAVGWGMQLREQLQTCLPTTTGRQLFGEILVGSPAFELADDQLRIYVAAYAFA